MNIAIIPARGQSKRIPRKNIKLMLNKPIISWVIEEAIHSGIFDDIVVSTDDEEIANVAKSFGAEVPFIRPESLSDDFTPTVPVIAHAIQECIKLNWKFDFVCCIYPCCPFLEGKDLQNGFKINFVDVDPNTWNIDVNKIEKAITSNTCAIMPVNLLGNSCDYAKLIEICREYDLMLIEDNCEAMGAKFHDKYCGTVGLAGSFSFFFSHHIQTCLLYTSDAADE